jgi:aminoglycoside phosphotransferase family enzyme/predicted kinase
MVTEDQSEVIGVLMRPSTHGGDAVERIDTHASMVFLAGSRALKLKRAVRYDYLDFSTIDRRRAMCEAEVRLNRRIAPAIYRGALPVTRGPDGSLALGGAGTPVDWVVEMARFDQSGLFDGLSQDGKLDLALMRPLASAVAGFHRDAERRADRGGRDGLARVIDGNARGLREQGDGVLDPARCDLVSAQSRSALHHAASLLDRRRDDGFVRQCHGDLHLRNLVLLEGRPTLFDAIEFNDDLSCIDVFYDLAFLLMDLWRRRLPRHANAVLNGYLAETQDAAGVSLLPLMLSCRAAIRAKTSVTASALQTDPARRGELQAASREYLDMALQLLRPAAPSLVAVGGLSGSGKSTLAQALAPSIGGVPGAVILRSDEIRKQLLGTPELVRLGPEGYTEDVSRAVYAELTRRATTILQGGHGVVADAVFASPDDRAAIERAALGASVPFLGLWLDAPETALLERIQHRGADVSDADAAVVRQQGQRDLGVISWRRIDASATPDGVMQRAMEHLAAYVGT